MYISPTDKSQPVTVMYDHEKDMQLSIQLNRWILKPIGAWPRSADSSWIKRCVHILVNLIYTCLIGFIFVPCAFYIVLEIEDTYNTLKFTGPLSFCIMVIAKYYSLILHSSNIRRCIDYIKDDWINTRHHGDRMIMIRNAEFGRRLVAISAVFTYGGAVFYHIAMPISIGKVTEEAENLTYRPLVYPVARAIVDTRQSPVSEIFFCIQCVAGFFTQAVTASGSSLAAVFAMHACGRLEILMQWIVHLVDGREDLCDNVDERLTMIVQQHVRILR
ncbi:hypothetical protein EAI_17422 [Harpegnathos saltator]|uniref:Odorant receptor 13a n=2 Tax=Harpegnathos saltator TaxID=610380 RepID=E2C072_HARSA|nr:hypothetical protein EAI_17422 [Harpegnathos saltator]